MVFMATIKPHVLAVADDLAFTFSSMSAERSTLSQVLTIVMSPVRVFDVAILRPMARIYNGLVGAAADGIEEAQAAQRVPNPVVQNNDVAPQTMEFAPSPSDAFNLLVLLQQRHAPIPIILPLPSVKTLGGVFDARVAVAITNTYLLTLAFGFGEDFKRLARRHPIFTGPMLSRPVAPLSPQREARGAAAGRYYHNRLVGTVSSDLGVSKLRKDPVRQRFSGFSPFGHRCDSAFQDTDNTGDIIPVVPGVVLGVILGVVIGHVLGGSFHRPGHVLGNKHAGEAIKRAAAIRLARPS
jgi:hypothetical protein